MSQRSDFEIARERAAARAPEPICDPTHAAAFGLVCGGFGLTLFAALGGLDLNDFKIAGLVVLGLAAGIPYLVLRDQQRRFWKAEEEELERLRMASRTR